MKWDILGDFSGHFDDEYTVTFQKEDLIGSISQVYLFAFPWSVQGLSWWSRPWEMRGETMSRRTDGQALDRQRARACRSRGRSTTSHGGAAARADRGLLCGNRE